MRDFQGYTVFGYKLKDQEEAINLYRFLHPEFDYKEEEESFFFYNWEGIFHENIPIWKLFHVFQQEKEVTYFVAFFVQKDSGCSMNELFRKIEEAKLHSGEIEKYIGKRELTVHTFCSYSW